ncbi:hypothetical protein RclHR1_03560012 [Rhizophagus clarus]|nr:hypothetical protein RclHR1_03560012 [Rhizophagus clarus]
MVNSHPNIIQFHGVTKLEDEERYSLVLEYADGGTLRDYLRNNTTEWKTQLRFAREITSAILWLHDVKEIVHGDLHSNNILIHKNTIKLVDFGRSFEKGNGCNNTEVWGAIPYVDPKMLDQTISYKLNEKSDIYSLGVLFWELASSSFIDDLEDNHITLGEAVPNTNNKFNGLYQKCLKQEPDERPNISEINETLSSIDNDESTVSDSEENEDSCQIDLNKLDQKL